VTLSARPVLAQRARVRYDRLSGRHILLAPERGFLLNASAAAILLLCNGQRSVRQIAQGLAPPQQQAQVLADIVALVEQLASRGLLVVNEP
jgi:pyrroloquinoline quinone biosynthesis protein D